MTQSSSLSQQDPGIPLLLGQTLKSDSSKQQGKIPTEAPVHSTHIYPFLGSKCYFWLHNSSSWTAIQITLFSNTEIPYRDAPGPRLPYAPRQAWLQLHVEASSANDNIARKGENSKFEVFKICCSWPGAEFGAAGNTVTFMKCHCIDSWYIPCIINYSYGVFLIRGCKRKQITT